MTIFSEEQVSASLKEIFEVCQREDDPEEIFTGFLASIDSVGREGNRLLLSLSTGQKVWVDITLLSGG